MYGIHEIAAIMKHKYIHANSIAAGYIGFFASFNSNNEFLFTDCIPITKTINSIPIIDNEITTIGIITSSCWSSFKLDTKIIASTPSIEINI